MSHLSDMKSDMDRNNISMLWEEWDEKSGIRDETVKKRELLRAACESGRGLPFGAQHIIEGDVRRETVEGLEGGEGFVGYREYKTKLEWVIGSLPVRFGGVIREFDIERLEWLTILLYFGELKKEVKEQKQLDGKGNTDMIVESDRDRIRTDSEASETDLPTVSDSEPESIHASDHQTSERSESPDILSTNQSLSSSFIDNCTDTGTTDILGDNRFYGGINSSGICPNERYMPFRNLMSQLGFSPDQDTSSSSPTTESRFQRVCSFAFNKSFTSNICMTVSRTNRHVLKIGELSDIWIQLEAGNHYKFLQERNEWWRTSCLGRTIQQEINAKSTLERNNEDNINKSSSDVEHSQRELVTSALRTRQKRAEVSRLRYQLGDGDQKYWHLEQSLSFMGYGMEFVRSELGHWVSNQVDRISVNEEEFQRAWRPRIRRRQTSNSINGIHSNKSASRESVGCRLGLFSSSFSDSIVTQLDQSWIERRSLQVRLLWEIQQLVEEQVKRDARNGEGGPSSELLMVHCILGFPALIVEMDDNEQRTSHTRDSQVEKRDKEEVNVSNDKNGNCMIQFCERQEDKKQQNTRPNDAIQDTRENTEKKMAEDCAVIWKIYVRPQCAPQELDVWIHLEKYEGGRATVIAGVEPSTSDENEYDQQFEWEWWRISFLSRLQGLAEWQEKHQFPFVPCDNNIGSITENIEEMQVPDIGTGKKLRIWNGWRPFRLSICRFELETPGFLLQDKKTDPSRLQWSSPGSGNITTDFILNRVEQVVIAYDQAGWKELHNCFLAMKDILEESCEEQSTTTRACDINDKTESDIPKLVLVPDKVNNLLNKGQEGYERAVLLLRETALKEKDGKSLEQCLNLMSAEVSMQRDLGGAIDLLHMFLTHGIDEQSHQEIADRGKTLAGAAIKYARQLWSDKDEREDLFQVLRLICVRILGMGEIDDLSTSRIEWLLSMLRVRVLRHREGSALLFLAEAEGDVWKTEVSLSTKVGKTEHEQEQFESLQVMEDVNGYFATCAVYERAIRESEGKVGQSGLLNEYGLQLQFGINGAYNDSLKAVQFYQRAIDAGHVHAINNLARMLENGAEGVDKDPQRAFELYQQAIDKGNTLAINNLGYMLDHGSEGVDKDPQRAVSLYERAINAGNSYAMNNLAVMLEGGAEGVPKDPQRAVNLYQRAINVRNALAMNNLAHLFEDGAEGVDKDLTRALSLYQRAVEAGNDLAMNNLGYIFDRGAEIVDKDPQRAVSLYEKAINAGNSFAMNNLAAMLKDGAEGVPKNPQRAFSLYQRAIDAGSADALYNMALLLEDGAEGVPKDIPKVISLYERAIEQERDTGAMNNLGYMFHYGADGVQVDLQKAMQLYQQAIEQGNEPRSMYHLGCLLHHADNTGIQKDVPKAKELYEQSIDEANDIDAMFALASLLETGDEGVASEPERAVELYQSLVVDHEHEGALKRISKLLEEGCEEPNRLEADGQRAVELYEKAMEGKLKKIAGDMLGRLLDRGGAGVAIDKERAVQLLVNIRNDEEDSVCAVERMD